MRFLSLAACLVACGFLHAVPTYNGPVKAQEVRAREGVGNFLTKLKAGKTYYVYVRAVKKLDDGTKVVGPWSKAAKIKIKKK